MLTDPGVEVTRWSLELAVAAINQRLDAPPAAVLPGLRQAALDRVLPDRLTLPPGFNPARLHRLAELVEAGTPIDTKLHHSLEVTGR